MKKNIIVLMLLSLLMLLSSCAAALMPYGKWENAELGMVLDIDPKYYSVRDFPGFLGTYVIDNEEIDIFVFFSTTHGGFAIWKEIDAPEWSGHNYDLALYRGTYRWSGEKQLRLRLDQQSQERTGMRGIIFELIEDYGVSG